MNRLSTFYCRPNGSMLGISMFLNRFEFARDRFSVHQERIQQFLDEIDAGFQIPASHEVFRDNFTGLYRKVLYVLTEKEDGRNVALFRPFALGFGFMAIALDMPNQTEQAMLESIMTECDLRPSLIQEHAASVPSVDDEISVDDVMNPALSFVRQITLPLKVEVNACFVAMPFAEPYSGYFPKVYQPLLKKNGFRSMRAWGGLSNEFPFDLLLTLIDKCGCVLPEVTTLNANVTSERGYALGKGKLVVQIADIAKPISLANTRGLAAIPYDSSKKGWEEDLVSGLGDLTMKAILEAAAEKGDL